MPWQVLKNSAAVNHSSVEARREAGYCAKKLVAARRFHKITGPLKVNR